MIRSLIVSFCLFVSHSVFCQDILTHPDWAKRGNIYEVNVRQYTREGTFNSFAKHLDRIRAMGVETLWFMPINPISHKDRKGTLGSYYAVADYTAVNPEFGTFNDFKQLVLAAHARGMHVLLDWVPNHTGADNRWLTEHPDFYKKDSTGKAAVPFDWTDTRQLDYGNPVLRDSMIAAMKYWITQTDIDGFRCDVAWNVPGDFWKDCIKKLKQQKSPFFMLAEGDKPYLTESGFDAVYPWDLFHEMVSIAKGESPASILDSALTYYDTAYHRGTLELYFTSNHDENSWNGADFSTFPLAAHAPFAVLTQTLPWGIPLIYGGQEEPVLRAISFFEKDTMSFRNYARAGFYETLLSLRRRNAALDADAKFTKLGNPADPHVYAFMRTKGSKRVLVVLNFSATAQSITLLPSIWGKVRDVFAGKKTMVDQQAVALEPWGYKIYEY